MTDDQWLAAARGRAAIDPLDWDADEDGAPAPTTEPPPELFCPYCADPPALRRLPRRDTMSIAEMLVCPKCYGIWAPAAALSQGIGREEHPAFAVVQGPARCRACFGDLKPDGACAKCGKSSPAVSCPVCRAAMGRIIDRGVRLDVCERCHGTWFDTGEIAAVFGRREEPSLVGAAIASGAAENRAVTGAFLGMKPDESPANMAFNIGLRALLGWLR